MTTEADLDALLGQHETQTLEFKSGRLLDEDPGKVAEDLSRAVSGFANGEGGRIVIGIREDRRPKIGVAAEIDGVDGATWTTHKLQQLVESNVEPPIHPRFTRVHLSRSVERVAFVIDVPEGSTAYQAKDGCYYARSEFEFKKLRDYEIRLRMHRATLLSAETSVTCTIGKSARTVLNEQCQDFDKELKALVAFIEKARDPTRSSIESADPSFGPRMEQRRAEIEAAYRGLSSGWRFDEIIVSIGLVNTCERTIRDYDVRINLEIPNSWLIGIRDNIQPRGGFHSAGDAQAVAGTREYISMDPTFTRR